MTPPPEKKIYRNHWWKRGFTCNTQSDPKGKHWATHQHAVDEIVVLLEGRIQVRVGASWRPIKKGEELVIPRQVPHSIHNKGPTQAHYLYGFRHKKHD